MRYSLTQKYLKPHLHLLRHPRQIPSLFFQALKRHRRFLLRLALALPLLLLAYGIFTYLFYIRTLADPQRLINNNQTGLTLLDRQGQIIYESPEVKNSTYTPLSEIPDTLIQATLAIEDRQFYDHVGFSPTAIIRSVYLNFRLGANRFGGSTITQQLVKNALLTPEKSLRRKYQELVLALEIERRYSKDQILEMYFNSIYYGSGAYGAASASQIYFDQPISLLNYSQAAVLAALPKAPSRLSPFAGNLDALQERQRLVLQNLLDLGQITQNQFQTALAAPLNFSTTPVSDTSLVAPHFALWVRDYLFDTYSEDTVIRSGFRVTTTLNASLQQSAQTLVKQRVQALTSRDVTNAGLVALNPQTGEVLVMVGSHDWNDPNYGKFNIAFARRQPGSAFKPIVYTQAFEEGYQPSNILHDVQTDFGGYQPKNYDDRFRGDVTIRRALANSLNVPAVELLNQVGIRDSLRLAQKMGITTLGNTDVGLSLVLGGSEVKLFELTRAYGVLAHQGIFTPTHPILEIKDKNDTTRYSFDPKSLEETTNKSLTSYFPFLKFFRSNQAQFGGSGNRQVIDPVSAYFTTHILADNQARSEVFGANSFLNLGRPAAAKTGTTNDNRDAWTIGYTPNLVVGVWVGNNDNTPMQGLTGSQAAAPIWSSFMRTALSGSPALEFPAPSGIVSIELCTNTLTTCTFECDATYTEIFRRGQTPSICRQASPLPTPSPSPSPTPDSDDQDQDEDQDGEDNDNDVENDDDSDQPTPTPQPSPTPTPTPTPLIIIPLPQPSPTPTPSPRPSPTSSPDNDDED